VAALAGAARAQDAALQANRDDLRCALAMTVIMKDDAYRQSATVGLYYFVGRLEARDPNLDLAQSMRREAASMQSSQWQGEIQRCGAALQVKTKNLEDLKGAFGARGVGRR
jgi:hypothetical protein